MRVLFTGMGSNHCSRPTNETFFTVLADAISNFAEVVWSSPKLSWTRSDLEAFDTVIFGFIAPTSLSANKIFGALHVLDILFDSPKLKLVADSPQMWQYKNSLNAVMRDPDLLFTPFYAKREGYSKAFSDRSKTHSAIEKLSSSEWPKVIYPHLPWFSSDSVARVLDFIDESKLLPLQIDSLLINPESPRIGRREIWAVENPKSSWLTDLEKTLALPRVPTKSGRKTDDDYALGILTNSIGLLIPPQERKAGTWWNYRLFQALNTGTPIATYWQDTYSFNPSWGILAYTIEDLDPAGRQSLAVSQRKSYLAAIPSKDQALRSLEKTVLKNKER